MSSRLPRWFWACWRCSADTCRIMAKKSAATTANRSAILNYAVLAGWVVGVGGLIVAAVVLVPRLVERVGAQAPSAPIRVTLVNEPAWLPNEDRRAIQLGVIKSLTGGPLDREGLQAAKGAVESSGWFLKVNQVSRPDPEQVVVQGEWSTPAALICDGQTEQLVDTKARLLPRSYPAGQGPKLLRIQGVAQGRPAAPGAVWSGGDLAAALEVAALANDRAWRTQIAAIDVSGFGRDGMVRLRTDAGREIIWGRTPGKEGAAEVPAVQKLAALQYLFDHSGRIDAGCEQVLDLRADIAVSLAPTH